METIKSIWPLCLEAELLCEELLKRGFERSLCLQQFAENVEKTASLRLFDLVDFFRVDAAFLKRVESLGFEPLFNSSMVFDHPRAQLPLIEISSENNAIGIQVESLEDFALVWGEGLHIEGSSFGEFRRAHLSTEGSMELFVVERRRKGRLLPDEKDKDWSWRIQEAKKIWSTRPRHNDSNLNEAFRRVEAMVKLVGQATTATLMLERERFYWQSRNRAGQLQKARQDRLGLGWANHDHHTFRSTRALFHRLVQLFEKAGFICRERFYAGKEAGWGAQVMEHPDVRLVLFLDVDLAPEEINIDFAHQELEPLSKLGTIGLWCALHGDSILEAGMHHLEGQFNFDRLKEDLAAIGISMMAPFSDFPYLRQAFTTAEVWLCDPRRIEALFLDGKITVAEKERFLKEGAIGSHLENLARRQGYKGFNQKNVSLIIRNTDPREPPPALGA